jgi:hypothetical protein
MPDKDAKRLRVSAEKPAIAIWAAIKEFGFFTA